MRCKVWFTSDTHFGHARIIELAKRPFKSVEEMDLAMIKRWNAVVAWDDIVYHLGDFAFADHGPYLDRLNGSKHLILGNHDHSNRLRSAGARWISVENYKEMKLEDGTRLVLCHYAFKVWNRSHHGTINLYGHSHGNLPGDSQSCDVGVDCWNFAPVNIEQIRARLVDPFFSRPRSEPDHHKVKP